jgi:2-oxoglutarate dehydrogenase E2 component (dihydrolipoamide succinyltransferase)
MAIVDLIMPKMGESIIEATVIAWQKKIGDVIDTEEIVVEVATDKVDSEIPSPIAGTLVEILIKNNEVVPIGGAMARIDTGQKGQTSTEATKDVSTAALTEALSGNQKTEENNEAFTSIEKATASKNKPLSIPRKGQSSHTAYFSPLVRNIARTEGISLEELDTIPGTGGESRVTKHDLIHYIKQKKQGVIAQIPSPLLASESTSSEINSVTSTANEAKAQAASISITKPAVKSAAGDEIIEMDRMRKVIASHMKRSQETSATVTSFVEADATHLVHWRNKNKGAYQERYNETLTFTPLFVEAVIMAIGDYPLINAMIDGDNIILKKDINIGIATAMENGNLIVPVIKNAGSLNLSGLTSKLNDLTSRARINKIKADEIQGGTFTISNIGTFGNIMGTPIINQPELAILALGAIKKKPVIQESSHGDIIAIRHMMFLSLSFDHRVIDGYLGGVFLNRIAQNIEAFDPNRSI